MRDMNGEPGEAAQVVDIFVHCQQHLQTHKDQDDSQAILEKLEIACYGCQGKIECAKFQNGKDVAGEYNKRVAADREYCGNAVNGKSHISGLDDEQRHKERRGHAAPVFQNKETVAVQLVGNRI